MAKDAQAEMITIGLKDEGGMVDEASGNEVPNGALKEEVRDDQPAMLSPGEFVIPAYAVRYIGVERLVGILREAKQGMEQLDDIGLTGEPNSDDAGLETAVLPSEMQEEGGMPTLAVGGMPTIKPGAVTTTALTNQPTQMSAQQFGVAPPAAIQPAAAPAFAAPSPLTQQMYRPTAPIRPPGQQNVTYPEFQYSPTPGGGGYGVEEYVGPQGQAIFVTTVGGKPVSKIPEGYVTRAEYTKKQEEGITTPTSPTELQRKPEDMDPGSFEASEGDESGTVITPDSLEAAVAALSGTKTVTAGNLATAAGFLGITGAGAAAVLGSILSYGAKANVVSILSQLGVIEGAKKPNGNRYSKEELIELATEEDDEGRTLSDRIDLDPENPKGARVALGKTEKDIEAANRTRTSTLVESAKEAAKQAARTEQAKARAAEYSFTPAVADATQATSSPSYEVTGADGEAQAVDPGTEAGLGLGLGATEADVSAAGEAGQSYSGGYGSDGSMEGIGMAEGGLIKVGDKTYGPEDFGFANKGTFVTKKKTRKRKTKKGKGLASSK